MIELSATDGILFFRECRGGPVRRGAIFKHKLSLAQRGEGQITKANIQNVSTNNGNNDGNISCSISSGRHRERGMTIFHNLSSALLVFLPITARVGLTQRRIKILIIAKFLIYREDDNT